MELPNWLRSKLWAAHDWLQTLITLCDEAAANESLAAASALDLAEACELIDPDRQRAIAMYRLASRRGAADAHIRASALALELGDQAARAELALASFEATRDVSWLAVAGFAFLDAGTPQLAVEPLARLVEARPRDEEAKSALAAVRRQLRDPQSEVATWIARAAKANRGDSARMYLHAARLARVAGLEAIHTKHLEAAVLRGSPEASALVEARLLQARSADALLTFYRNQLERVRNDHEWTETMRAAGCKLSVRGIQRGLAVRLVRSSLEHAYRSRLADIPGHLAAWSVLARHARDTRSMPELLPLIAEAMTLALPDDDRLYLARLGFEITLRVVDDREAARPYAALIANLVPDDPDVGAFAGPPLRAEPVVIFTPSPKIPDHPQRQAERVILPIDVEVQLPSDERFAAVVRDVSTLGLFVVTDRAIEIGTELLLELQLPGASALSQVAHRAAARVVRRAPTGYGLVLITPSRALVDAIAALSRVPQ